MTLRVSLIFCGSLLLLATHCSSGKVDPYSAEQDQGTAIDPLTKKRDASGPNPWIEPLPDMARFDDRSVPIDLTQDTQHVDAAAPNDATLASQDVNHPDMVQMVKDAGKDVGILAPQLVISEIMVDPNHTTDDKGEWLELHNYGKSGTSLHGWTLSSTGQKHVIQKPDLWIQPGQYLVLARNGSPAANGGVSPGYVYGTGITPSDVAFANGTNGDTVELISPTHGVVTKLTYNSKWPFKSGYSMSLRTLTADPQTQTNWCTEASKWTGSAGDFGSPGASQRCN